MSEMGKLWRALLIRRENCSRSKRLKAGLGSGARHRWALQQLRRPEPAFGAFNVSEGLVAPRSQRDDLPLWGHELSIRHPERYSNFATALPSAPDLPQRLRVHRMAYSITSSACASSVGGTVTPAILAVLRLITSSYFVGSWIGRSATFAPLIIRSTYDAARL